MCSDQVTQDLELFLKIIHQWMCMNKHYLLLAMLIDWNWLIYLLSNHLNTWRWCVICEWFFAVMSKYLDFMFAFLIADLNKDHLNVSIDKGFLFLYLIKWCIFFNMFNTKYQSLCWLRPKIITVSGSKTDLI